MALHHASATNNAMAATGPDAANDRATLGSCLSLMGRYLAGKVRGVEAGEPKHEPSKAAGWGLITTHSESQLSWTGERFRLLQRS